MKKKRFIKLLIAHGLSPYAAQDLAKKAQQHRIPYFKALGDYLTWWWVWSCNIVRPQLGVNPDNAWLEVLAGE